MMSSNRPIKKIVAIWYRLGRQLIFGHIIGKNRDGSVRVADKIESIYSDRLKTAFSRLLWPLRVTLTTRPGMLLAGNDKLLFWNTNSNRQ